MLFTFDKTQKLINSFGDDSFTQMNLTMSTNEAAELTFAMPKEHVLPKDVMYVAVPYPNQHDQYLFFRLLDHKDGIDVTEYQAMEYAYQELSSYGYIKDLRPSNRKAEELIHIALLNTGWALSKCNIGGSYSTNFYFNTPLEALQKILDVSHGEYRFYVTIEGNKITGRYVDYLIEQGQDTGYRFDYGSNLIEVVRTTDVSDVYTAILPRGKGEEIDNGDPNTPDGYGRRILIDDVTWSKTAGNPLDKPKGESILTDPVARTMYGQMDGKDRLRIEVFDDIDDPNVLINAAYKWLQEHNHERIECSAQVADGHQLNLGDRVAIVKHDDKRDLSYRTRVFKIEYDLLNPYNTKLSLGDDLSSSSLINQINRIESSNSKTNEMINWTLQNGDGSHTSYSPTAPAKAKEGDIWYKQLPNGDVEIYRYENGQWTLIIDAATGERVTNEVNKALSDAKSYSDSLDNEIKTKLDASSKQTAEEIAQANQDIADANSKIADAEAGIAKSQQDIANLDNRVSADFANQQKEIEDITANVNSLGQVNQLFNSEFNPDLANWKMTPNSVNDTTQKFNGSNVVKTMGPAGFGLTYKIPVQEGLRIGYRMWIKGAKNTAENAAAEVKLIDQNNADLAVGKTAMQFTGDWQEFTWIGTIPAGVTKITMYMYGNNGAWYLSQPMMVFDVKDKVGAYVPGSYNNNDQIVSIQKGLNGLQVSVIDNKNNISSISDKADKISVSVSDLDKSTSAAIQVTKNSIAQEVKDRQSGDSNVLVQAKNYTISQVSDKATKTELIQTAKDITLRASPTNMVNNSEFEWTNDGYVPGWHLDSPWGETVASQLHHNGMATANAGIKPYALPSNMVMHDFPSSHNYIYSDPIFIDPNQKISSSLTIANPAGAVPAGKVGLSYRVMCYDGNKKELGNIVFVDWTKVGGEWTVNSHDNLTPKPGTVFIAMVMGWNDGRAYFGQPFIQMGEKYTGYVPNRSVTRGALQVTNDHITSMVSDYNGKFSTLNQTVNGISTEVKGKADISLVNQTASSLTAKFSSVNLFPNTEFDSNDGDVIAGWYNAVPNLDSFPNVTHALQSGPSTAFVYNHQYSNSGNYKGLTSRISHNQFGKDQTVAAPTTFIKSEPRRANPGDPFTLSAVATIIPADSRTDSIFAPYIWFYDRNKNLVGRKGLNFVTQNKNEILVLQADAPSNTYWVSAGFGMRGHLDFSQPMLELGRIHMAYVPNTSASVSILDINKDRLTTQITGVNGKISTLTQSVNGLSTQVSNTYTKSEVNQKSDAILARITNNNFVANTEFYPDEHGKYPGWHDGGPWGRSLTGSDVGVWNRDWLVNGFKSAHAFHSSTNWVWYSSDPIEVGNMNYAKVYAALYGSANGGTYPADSAMVVAVSFYDVNKANLNKSISKQTPDHFNGVNVQIEGTIPVGAKYMAMTIGLRGHVDFTQPVLSANGYSYSPNNANTSTIMGLFKDNFAFGIADNTGKIISGINGDTSGLHITGSKIYLDGNVLVDGSFWAKQVNAVKVNAGNIVTGTLDAARVNVINMNANNITTGTLNASRVQIHSNTTRMALDSGMTLTTLSGSKIIQIGDYDFKLYDTNQTGKLIGGIRTSTDKYDTSKRMIDMYMAPAGNATEDGVGDRINFSYLDQNKNETMAIMALHKDHINTSVPMDMVMNSIKRINTIEVDTAPRGLAIRWVQWSDVGNNYHYPCIMLNGDNLAGIAWTHNNMFAWGGSHVRKTLAN